MSQVSYGTITITDTNDIESITVEYNRNQSSSSAPSATDSGWSTIRPSWAQGYYIWQRTRVHKSGTTADQDVIGTAVCITGSTGSTGAPGRGLTDTITQYCNYGAGEPADDYSGWVDAPPTYDSSKPNYWVMITNTYSAEPTSEIIKYKDEALTKTVSDSAIANSVAQHASEDAQGALSQAAAAQQQVTQVDTLLGGHFSFGDALSTKTPSGARIVEQLNDSPTQWLHNVNIGANGIQLRYNEAVMAQLAATNSDSSNDIALKFYQPPTINGSTTTQGNLTMALKGNALTFYDPTIANGQVVQATLDANGLKLLKGGIESGSVASGNGYIYLSTADKGSVVNTLVPTPSGGTPKTDWRAVIGTKFGVDSEGNLYANNATISGAITATSLTLGAGVKLNAETDINNLASVATTGSYNDLSNKPTIPSLTGYIHTDGTIGSTAAEGANSFTVASSGALTASNAIIYGTLYASKGYVGGWRIGTDGNKSLHNGTTDTSPTINNNTIILSKGLTSTTSVAGSTGEQTWTIVAGTNFGVTTEGELYATGASISGTINATQGSIGGATIQNGQLLISSTNITDTETLREGLATIDQLNEITQGDGGGTLQWNGNALEISSDLYSVVISPSGINLNYQGTPAASIDQDRLKIGKTMVLDEMQVGEGNWTWKFDPDDNSIFLKWIGE